MELTTRTTFSEKAFVTFSLAREQFGANDWNSWHVDYGIGFFSYPNGHCEFARVIDCNLPKIEPTIKTCTLDGKAIAYTKDTVFEVQCARGRASYKTRWSFKGNFGQAFQYYRGLNIGNGYKKRLFCRDFEKPVIARQFS